MDSPWWLSLAVAAVSAGAALAGHAIGARSARHQRAHAYLREQLIEFYAPMAGLRERIRVLSEFREKVSNAADNSWRDLASTYGHVPERDRLVHLAVIPDNNRQLEEELLPMYRQMMDLFTAKYHLSEPTTREYFPVLVEFCEGWRRHMARAVPADVIVKVMPSEKELHPFYDEVTKTTERLRLRVQQGHHGD